MLRLDDKRIMVVDYDAEQVKGLCAELKHQGLEPIGFTSSTAALNEIEVKAIPLVITELDMPQINGVQLTRTIKHLYPESQVILTAKCDNREGSLRALRAGASDFLEKPVNTTLFRKTISRALQRYAGRRQR